MPMTFRWCEAGELIIQETGGEPMLGHSHVPGSNGFLDVPGQPRLASLHPEKMPEDELLGFHQLLGCPPVTQGFSIQATRA